MKAKIVVPLIGLLLLTGTTGCIPLLLLAVAPTSNGCTSGTTLDPSMDAILATIRHLESRDDYSARAPGSTASGAYQFLDGTWAGYGGYARAHLAPPEVQDAKAVEHVRGILSANNDDPASVPVVWYIGHLPSPGSSSWDIVPAPGAGNRLTPREYQAKWMEVYRQKLSALTSGPTGTMASAIAGAASGTDASAESPAAHPWPQSAACPTGALAVSGDYALPVERRWYDEHPEWFTKPHHDYPAADIPVPTGTQIYAAAGGVVVSTTTSGSCGIGVVINGDDRAQYTYCHGLPGSHAISVGDRVRAGHPLMKSASTGNSDGPHLHFAIKIEGTARCPQQFLAAVARDLSISMENLPTSGCSY